MDNNIDIREGKLYCIELKCGDYLIPDSNVIGITLTNQLIIGLMPKVIIDLELDQFSIISEKMYGQENLKLTIKTDDLSFTLDLIYLESSFILKSKTQESEQQDFENVAIEISAYIQPCWELLSNSLNYIMEEPGGSTPLDTIQSAIVDSGISSSSLMFDSRNKNEETINQLIIPHMTINKLIDFMNEKYAIYKGSLHKYCAFDLEQQKPFFQLGDYSELITDIPNMIIHMLPLGDTKNTQKDIINKTMKEPDKILYTTKPLKVLYFQNSNVIKNSFIKKQILHPDDDLHTIISNDMDSVIKKLGVNDTTKISKMTDSVKSNERYYFDLKGFQYDESILSSRMANQIKNCSTIHLTIDNMIFPATNLVKVGTPVQLEPNTTSLMNYQGKYILHSSEVYWNKQKDQWICSAELILFRTTQEK